ncbi:hypothetical protein ACI7YW_20900 [Clostridium ljungdahlii]|uniref:Uncharacterized protein n=1 Tax=Clostridium autoethanogenum DSM 10061 TaxID=1341692 RepID=A0ABY4TPK7_9CLOT|nr:MULTISPECIES: hypothetical protein [Clostridium]URS74489.1 hypothetical protein CAETHG_04520 [Clostridium autoethanogenum DSM 10061]
MKSIVLNLRVRVLVLYICYDRKTVQEILSKAFILNVLGDIMKNETKFIDEPLVG